MEHWQRRHIIENLPELVVNTYCDVELLTRLQSGKKLSKCDVDSIKSKKEKAEQSQLLYNILETRVDGYGLLAFSLAECCQSGAFSILMKGFANQLLTQLLTPAKYATFDANEKERVIKQILKHCTPENFIEMCNAKGSSNLDKTNLLRDTIPPQYTHYIPRTLSKRLVVMQNIFTAECPDVFVFKNIGQFNLSTKIDGQLTASSECYLSDCSSTSRFIVLDADADWKDICDERKAPAHLLNYDKQTKQFILEETTGDSQILLRFLCRPRDKTNDKSDNDGFLITEQEFIQEIIDNKSECKGYCICDSPGMGKTLLLSNLARNIAQKLPEKNVVFIRLSDLMQKIQTGQTEMDQWQAEEIVLEYVSTCTMAKCILNELLKADILQLELFLDGLDEVSQELAPKVLELLSCLISKLQNARIYVTSRSHLRQELETSLGVISYDILPFTLLNSRQFVINIWSKQGVSENLALLSKFATYCINEFEQRISKDERNITGIPLQCKLLAQVYEKKAKRFCRSEGKLSLDGFFTMENSLSQLYRKFILQSLEKCNSQQHTGFAADVQNAKNYHTWIALKTVFPEISNTFAFEFGVSTDAQINKNIFSAGLLETRVDGSEQEIVFVHRTLAECMAAEFFVATLEAREFGQCSDSFLDVIVSFLFEQVLRTSVFFYYEHPVVVYFINHALSENATLWFLNNHHLSKNIFEHSFLDLTFFTDLHTCLCQNYVGIYRLITTLVSPLQIEKPSDATLRGLRGLVEFAASDSSLLLVKEVCTFAASKFHFDVFQEYQNNKNSIKGKILQTVVRRGDFEVAKYFLDKISIEGENLIAHGVHISSFDTTTTINGKLEICKLLKSKNSMILAEMNDVDGVAFREMNYIHLRLINWLILEGADLESPGWRCGLAVLNSLVGCTNPKDVNETLSILAKHGKCNLFVAIEMNSWRSGLHYIFASKKKLDIGTLKMILQNCDKRILQGEDFINTLLLTALGTNQSHGILNTLFQYSQNRGNFPTDAKNVVSYLRLLRVDRSRLDEDHSTFLHLASQNYQPEEYHEIVSFLKEQGNTELFHVGNKFGQLPINRAVRCMEVQEETLRLFFTCGVNFNVEPLEPSYSLLMHAVRGKRSVKLLKVLIDMGADVHQKDYYGETFVHHIYESYSSEDCTEVMRYIADKEELTNQAK